MTVATDWEPVVTQKEADKLDISKEEYEQAALYARTTVEEHEKLGTDRHEWEPTRSVNDMLAGPYLMDGEEELATRLEREADPALDRSQGLVEEVKKRLDEITEHTQPLTTLEAGTKYSVPEAVARVDEHDTTIRQHEAAGRHHHHRSPRLLKILASWAPWLEALGFLTFLAYYLNVPILEPWQDWLGWSFAVVVVVVIILGQTWLVRHAGRSHNHAREDLVEGHRHEAERGFTKRDRYLWLTAVTAVAITAGMIWRGTAALGNASTGTTVVMIFVAGVTGLLLPTLAYLGFALDGSRVSRERDGLAGDLDDDLDDYLETISDSRRDLARVAEIGETLKDKTFPDICHTTQETVDGVYEPYSTVRLLIGGLSADPLTKTTKTVVVDPAGNISGYIGTSIPGAGTVNLGPLFDRQHRLERIEAERAGLLGRIENLPEHPWGKSRT
jgi:hypothetical protein